MRACVHACVRAAKPADGLRERPRAVRVGARCVAEAAVTGRVARGGRDDASRARGRDREQQAFGGLVVKQQALTFGDSAKQCA